MDAQKDAALTASRDASKPQQADCAVLAIDALSKSAQLPLGPYYSETPSRLTVHDSSNSEDTVKPLLGKRCLAHLDID